MTATHTEIDPVLLGFLNDEPSLACDNADSEWCAKEEVKWRALVKCPACKRGRTELWCDPCKCLVTVTEDGFECAQCEELVFPARRFVSMFLPLEGK